MPAAQPPPTTQPNIAKNQQNDDPAKISLALHNHQRLHEKALESFQNETLREEQLTKLVDKSQRLQKMRSKKWEQLAGRPKCLISDRLLGTVNIEREHFVTAQPERHKIL